MLWRMDLGFAQHLALTGLLALAACTPASAPAATGGNAPAPTDQRADQQVLRVAVNGLIGNPTPQSSAFNPYQFWPMYDNLTQFGKDFEVLPSTAEKWELAPDGLSWNFTIRKDMKFSNGDPLTAEDVAFSINNMLEKRWPTITYFATTTGAKVTSENVVNVTTKQVDLSVPNGGAYLWIIPKKYFEQVGFDTFVTKPIGSGPYDLVEFRNADRIVYKKRSEPHAFRKPIATDITFQAISDPSQAVNGMRTGEIDLATAINFTADQADALKREGFSLQSFPTQNLSAALVQGGYEARNTPLKDVRVRAALNYAIDREGIAKNIFRGYAIPASQLSVEGSQYWDNNLKLTPYDPAKAKQLLAEAGYPNGFTLANGMDFTPSQVPQDLVLAVQSNFRDVGVIIEPKVNELSVYVDKAYGRNNQVMGDIAFGSSGDANGFFTSSRAFVGCGKPNGGAATSGRYCNPAWDKALDDAIAERDPQKRRQLFLEANRIHREDNAHVLLVVTSAFVVNGPKVRDVIIPISNAYNFDSVYKVK